MLRNSKVNKFEFSFVFKKRGCKERKKGGRICSNLTNILKSNNLKC